MNSEVQDIIEDLLIGGWVWGEDENVLTHPSDPDLTIRHDPSTDDLVASPGLLGLLLQAR